MMSSTTVASATFPNRRAAEEAMRRLVEGGFARNSIDLHQHDNDGGYDLSVHTRQKNLKRVEKLMHTGSQPYSLSQVGSSVAQVARSHPILLAGAGILAGFTIFSLLVGFGAMQTRQRSARRRTPSGRHSR